MPTTSEVMRPVHSVSIFVDESPDLLTPVSAGGGHFIIGRPGEGALGVMTIQGSVTDDAGRLRVIAAFFTRCAAIALVHAAELELETAAPDPAPITHLHPDCNCAHVPGASCDPMCPVHGVGQ